MEDADDDIRAPRQLIAENSTACDFFLSTVTSKAGFKLTIGSSLIVDAGNGLFARQGIAAGQEIYRSTPVIRCVDATNRAICHNCLHDSASTLVKGGRFQSGGDAVPVAKPCSGCRVATFCSKQCQKAAWYSFHKYECKILGESPTLPARSLALFRLLLQHKHHKLSTAQWLAVEALQSNFAHYSTDEKAFENVSALANWAEEKTQHGTPAYKLWSLVCATMTNCIAIRPAVKKQSLGVSLDLVTSLINHDCQPNIFVFFEGDELRARSIRSISAGEELTRCYCDPTMDVLLRQHVLKAEQFFECNCSRCKDELRERRKLLGKGDMPNKFASLVKSQRDVLGLVQSAGLAATYPGLQSDFESLDKVESKLRFITAGAFPTSHWPDDLEPLPSARMALGALRVNKGDSLEALRLMLRGCMLGKRDRQACGAERINEMVDLARVLMVLGNAPANSDLYTEDMALPGRAEVRMLVAGYLSEIGKGADRIFGSDACYSMALRDWLRNVLHGLGPDATRPGSEGFEPAFRRAQAKLLLWAGVDKYMGMMLSS